MLLSCVVIIYVYTQPWAYRGTPDGIGLAAFPVFFLVCVFICSAACFFESYRNLKAGKECQKGDATGMAWLPTMGVCIVSMISSYAVTRVDPLLLVAVFGIVVLLLGSIRKWYFLLGVALGEALFIYIFILRIAEVFFPVSWFE
jgi:hypothetical protein